VPVTIGLKDKTNAKRSAGSLFVIVGSRNAS
jgi:hypothetical protein